MSSSEEIYQRELIRIRCVEFGEWIRSGVCCPKVGGTTWIYGDEDEEIDTFQLYEKFTEWKSQQQ